MTVGHSIVTPAEVSTEWLTAALRAHDIDAEVAAFEIEQVGTGQLGETRRFHLQYKGSPPANAPATLVGKFPSDNEVAATTGKEMVKYCWVDAKELFI